MATPASSSRSTLPLSWRLRRALAVALLLGLWAPVKLLWEQHIAREQDFLRYRGVTVTRELRDQLGQGLTIGVLSGMRSVVADLVWLETIPAWMHEDWFEMSRVVNLSTLLQPRTPLFWEMGGWHLGWNASLSALNDPHQPNELRRLKASRFWIDQAISVYKRGIENNPTDWRLWTNAAQLYQQRLRDYRTAAYYYQKASEQPKSPFYLEHDAALMYELAGDDAAAYESWKALWLRLTPEERQQKLHAPDLIEKHTRRLEQKLSVPKEKRIFPN